MYHRRLKIMRPEDEAALRQREVGFLVELEVGNMRYPASLGYHLAFRVNFV